RAGSRAETAAHAAGGVAGEAECHEHRDHQQDDGGCVAAVAAELAAGGLPAALPGRRPARRRRLRLRRRTPAAPRSRLLSRARPGRRTARGSTGGHSPTLTPAPPATGATRPPNLGVLTGPRCSRRRRDTPGR